MTNPLSPLPDQFDPDARNWLDAIQDVGVQREFLKYIPGEGARPFAGFQADSRIKKHALEQLKPQACVGWDEKKRQYDALQDKKITLEKDCLNTNIWDLYLKTSPAYNHGALWTTLGYTKEYYDKKLEEYNKKQAELKATEDQMKELEKELPIENINLEGKWRLVAMYDLCGGLEAYESLPCPIFVGHGFFLEKLEKDLKEGRIRFDGPVVRFGRPNTLEGIILKIEDPSEEGTFKTLIISNEPSNRSLAVRTLGEGEPSNLFMEYLRDTTKRPDWNTAKMVELRELITKGFTPSGQRLYYEPTERPAAETPAAAAAAAPTTSPTSSSSSSSGPTAFMKAFEEYNRLLAQSDSLLRRKLLNSDPKERDRLQAELDRNQTERDASWERLTKLRS